MTALHLFGAAPRAMHPLVFRIQQLKIRYMVRTKTNPDAIFVPTDMALEFCRQAHEAMKESGMEDGKPLPSVAELMHHLAQHHNEPSIWLICDLPVLLYNGTDLGVGRARWDVPQPDQDLGLPTTVAVDMTKPN